MNKLIKNGICTLTAAATLASLVPSLVYADTTAVVADKEINFTFSQSYQNSTDNLTITAAETNGTVLWNYQAKGYPAAQLSAYTEIGVHNNLYYFCEAGHVIALDPITGEKIWENSDFGGYPSKDAFDFDEEGTLYVSGYLQPDLGIIDRDGQTLKIIKELNPDYYWPYLVAYLGDRQLRIIYENCVSTGKEAIVDYDLDSLGIGVDDGNGPVVPFDSNSIQSISATSALSEYGMTHTASRVMDHSLANAWVEGAAGTGTGESLTFQFSSTQTVSGMKIHAGYQKSSDLYYKNARPASLRIQFSDGHEEVCSLQDTFGVQDLKFAAPVNTEYIKVIIDSVYNGSRYQDTVISEIEFY